MRSERHKSQLAANVFAGVKRILLVDNVVYDG